MNTTQNTMLNNLVLYFSDSLALDESGKLLVQTPHDKGSVEPPSLDGTISSEEQSDHPKKIHEMSLCDRVEYAQELKGQAAKDFALKDYKTAYRKYARAVDAVQIATEKADKMVIDGRVPAVMLLITCSIKAATCARNLEQWDEAERFALNAIVIVDRLEPKLGETLRLQVDQTAYLRIFGEWRVKSLMVMAQALTEKQHTEQAIKILKRAQDVITKYSAPDFVQQPLLKSLLKRLSAQDEEVLRLLSQCIRQRQAELCEAERKKVQHRAQEIFVASPHVTDLEEEKEEANSQPACPDAQETPAPLPRRESILDSNGNEMSTAPKEDATESMRENVSLSNKQGNDVNVIGEEATLAWYHNVRALTGVLTAILVVSFAVRSQRR
jgi:tetratricopeptide (TPR) repeat protein